MSDRTAPARVAVCSDAAPAPAGTYSQGVITGGMLYVSGQTPRMRDGRHCADEPFRTQAWIALTNVDSIARAAGARLCEAAFVTVYLRNLGAQAAEFDAVYRESLGAVSPYPARAVVQSDLPHGEVEIAAVIPLPITRTVEPDDDV